MTLMPEETTLPSTRSARKLVLFHSAKGTRMKPASVVSLNSSTVMKSWIARMKKARTTRNQATSSTTTIRKLPKIRSEEHTSEVQSLMRISYAVFCSKKNISFITVWIRRMLKDYDKQYDYHIQG